MIQYPKFKRALRLWQKAAVKILMSAPNSIEIEFSHIWRRDNQGDLRRYDVHNWKHSVTEKTKELPQWKTVLSEVKNYPAIERHLDQLVGNYAMRMRMDAEQVLLSFIPRPRLKLDYSGMEISPDDFNQKYAAFERFISADTYENHAIWPVIGADVENDILINPDIRIRRLTEQEISDCINHGIITPGGSQIGVVGKDFSQYVGLVVRSVSQKIIGEAESDPQEYGRLEKEEAFILENIKTVAALTGISNIHLGGRIEITDGWPSGLRNANPGNSTVASHFSQYNPTLIDRKASQNLKRLWNALSVMSSAKNLGLSLALRRLAYAQERSREDDHLMDLMIAAEALYLNDAGAPQEKGELKFRLSLRAASWSQPSKIGMPKGDVFKLMKNAYDARSAIAHGGVPAPSLLKYQGQPLSQTEFNNKVQIVIRCGLQRAIAESLKSPNKKFTRDWEPAIIEKL